MVAGDVANDACILRSLLVIGQPVHFLTFAVVFPLMLIEGFC